MRFSTNNSASLIHDANLTLSGNFKKVFSTIVKKLPHSQQKVVPATSTRVKNDKKTMIKVVAKSSAISKEDDVYRNLRNYYSNNSSKRQTVLSNEEEEQAKKNNERETRHKTVKQYQQPEQIKKSSANYHWKEHSTMSNNINNTAPQKYQTHNYIRDSRSNPNFLRIQAMTNNSSKIIVMNNKEKPYLKKRQDDFVWGNPSPLRD